MRLAAMNGGVLVGRHVELDALRQSLAAALTGRGGVVLLVGEPGIGKSRLVEELARIAEPDATVVWGRAWEAGGAPAFWPWTQVLRAAGGPVSSPQVQRLLDAGDAPAPASADRFLVFDAVARHLLGLSAARPVVVVLEDLHAADEPSLHLLAFVADQVRRAPLLVVGTYRDVEARLTPAAGAVLDRVARGARVIHPRRLGVDDVVALARDGLGIALDAQTLQGVHHRTEGNPLFVVELLRVAAQHGTAAVPAGVRTAIREHLAALPDELRPVLEVAAVFGRELHAAAVAGVANVPAASIHDALGRAVTLGVIVDRSEGRFAFAHGLIAETLHDDLPAARRTGLHLAIADWLQRDPSPALTEIAHHLLLAGPEHADRAAEAVRAAAERARRQLAFESAGALIERALSAPGTSKRLRFELVRLLAEVRLLAGGDDARGKDTARDAAELARTLDSPELIARAALTYGLGYSFGFTDQVLVQLLEEGLAALPPGDSPLRARLLARLAAALTPARVATTPMMLARDAIAMADRLDDDRTRLDVFYAATSALIPFAPPRERYTINHEVLTLAQRLDEPLIVLRSHLRLALDCIELADIQGFEAQRTAYDASAASLRLPRARWQSAMLRGMRALLEGRFDDDAAALEEALRLAADAGDDFVSSFVTVGHGVTRACLLGDDATLTRERESFSLFASVPNQSEYPEIASLLHVRLGELDAARARVSRLSLGRLVLDHHLAVTGVWAAEVAWELGDRELAADLYPWLATEDPPLPALHLHGFAAGRPMAHGAMQLADVLGDVDGAARHYESALRLVTAINARPLEAWLYLDRARMIRDPAAARALLGKARVIATDLGMPILARIDAVQAALARDASSPPLTVAAATARSPSPTLTIRQEGDTWLVEGLGASCRIKAGRGIEMLARLVGEPGRELHALDLIGAEVVDAGDAGEVLDAEAKRAYRTRVLELREELEEAEQWNDSVRAERMRDELEALEAELSRAAGLGGRDRRVGKAAERARINVQRRIADAVKRISEGHADLGRHLAATIRTGTYCSYAPERATRPVR